MYSFTYKFVLCMIIIIMILVILDDLVDLRSNSIPCNNIPCLKILLACFSVRAHVIMIGN